MKKAIIMLMGIAMGATAANAQNVANNNIQKQTSQSGKLVFEKDTYDFGEVTEGPAAQYDFVFSNTGKAPVIISKVVASCGCTTPTWPSKPVSPGTKDKIHVSYNTQGRPGPFVKDVTVFSDAEQATMVVHIKGTVKTKPAGIAASVPPSSATLVK